MPWDDFAHVTGVHRTNNDERKLYRPVEPDWVCVCAWNAFCHTPSVCLFNGKHEGRWHVRDATFSMQLWLVAHLRNHGSGQLTLLRGDPSLTAEIIF